MASNFVLMHVHHVSYIDLMTMEPWYRELYLFNLQQWEAEKQRQRQIADAKRSAG